MITSDNCSLSQFNNWNDTFEPCPVPWGVKQPLSTHYPEKAEGYDNDEEEILDDPDYHDGDPEYPNDDPYYEDEEDEDYNDGNNADYI